MWDFLFPFLEGRKDASIIFFCGTPIAQGVPARRTELQRLDHWRYRLLRRVGERES